MTSTEMYTPFTPSSSSSSSAPPPTLSHSSQPHPRTHTSTGYSSIHEDSPPGLTASGSSDDGSSPSSIAEGPGGSSSSRSASSSSGSRHAGPRNHRSQPSSIAAPPSSKAATDSTYDPMSPWANASSTHGSDGGYGDVDWAMAAADHTSNNFGSPMHYIHSSPMQPNDPFAPHQSSSSMPHNDLFAGTASPMMGIVADQSQSATHESKQELRAAAQRMANRNADYGGYTSFANGNSTNAKLFSSSASSATQPPHSTAGVGNSTSSSSSAPLNPWAPSSSSSSSFAQDVKSNFSDEQMFDSLIDESSFGPPSTHVSEYAASPDRASTSSQQLPSAFGDMRMDRLSSKNNRNDGHRQSPSSSQHTSPARSTSAMKTEPTNEPMIATPSTSTAATQVSSPPTSVLPSASASRRSSVSMMSRPSIIAALQQQCDGDPSMSSEGEISFSASNVVRPATDNLGDLQVHVHGIPARGAKSRVETQIKAHLELVRPLPGAANGSSENVSGWERIGSFSHLKLPPLSATKRKTKKNQQNSVDIPKEKTLYLDVAVVNASPPHNRAFACSSCSEREKKRAERRKSGRAKSGPVPSDEEMRKLGIDPADPNAAELAAEKLTQEESKRIILFNCGDYIEFKDGHAELPTRITCYCRHHKEKLGFCILFTMRNWKGESIACGSTPAIMITDDHKSSAALEKMRREAMAAEGNNGGLVSPTSEMPSFSRHRSATSVDRSRDQSLEADTSHGAGTGANRTKAKKNRSKPYDAPPRRPTIGASSNSSNNANATVPLMSPTGQRPAMSPGSAPSSSSAQAPVDLIQALAAIGNEQAMYSAQAQNQAQAQGLGQGQSPATSSSANPSSAPTPFGAPWATQLGLPQQTPPNVANMLAEGSISPDTLATNPMSLPGLDIMSSPLAQQMLALLGQQAFLPAQPTHHAPQPPQSQRPDVPQANIARIIPGEGPTTGGVEVTVLGENFTEGLTCFFGDLAAISTTVWAANTLVCVLPPSPSPGPVAVTLKSANEASFGSGNQPRRSQANLQLFTYVDNSDTKLMELALQVVGFQQTRTMQASRDIACRLLASAQGSANGMTNGGSSTGGQGYTGGRQARDSIANIFAGAATTSFQDNIINFLGLLDVDLGLPRRMDAIRLANTNSQTLLHLATMLGFHRLAIRLLQLGCPIDAKDRNGLTALHLAALNGRSALVNVLLSHGARTHIISFGGKTPFDFAHSQQHADIEAMLQQEAAPSIGRLSGASSVGAETFSDEESEEIDDGNVSTCAEESWDSEEEEEDELDWLSERDSDEDEDEEEDDEDDDDEESAADADGESEAEDIVARTSVPLPVSVSSGILTSASSPLASNAATPRPPSSPVGEKSFLPAFTRLDEKKTTADTPSAAPLGDVKDSKLSASSKSSSTTSLRSLATKLPGGLNLLARTDRFLPHAMQLQQRMQAVPVSVFNMALPSSPNLANLSWRVTRDRSSDSVEKAGTLESSNGRSATSAEKQAMRSTTAAAEDDETDSSGLMNLWRHFVEERLLRGQSPTAAVPTADEAEDATATANSTTGGQHQPPAYASVQPLDSDAISSSSSSSPCPSAASREGKNTSPSPSPSTKASRSATSTSPSTTTLSKRSPTPASSSSTSSPTSTSNSTSTSLEDDWMLVWFWLPALLIAFLMAVFTSGPLSLRGLVGYVPKLGAGGAAAAAAAAAP